MPEPKGMMVWVGQGSLSTHRLRADSPRYPAKCKRTWLRQCAEIESIILICHEATHHPPFIVPAEGVFYQSHPIANVLISPCERVRMLNSPRLCCNCYYYFFMALWTGEKVHLFRVSRLELNDNKWKTNRNWRKTLNTYAGNKAITVFSKARFYGIRFSFVPFIEGVRVVVTGRLAGFDSKRCHLRRPSFAYRNDYIVRLWLYPWPNNRLHVQFT